MNRRATVRFRCTPPEQGRAFLANSSKSVDGTVVDFSLGGIQLILDGYLELGTILRIEMGTEGTQPCVDLVAHVIHATKMESGEWRYGCEWARALAAEELLLLR